MRLIWLPVLVLLASCSSGDDSPKNDPEPTVTTTAAAVNAPQSPAEEEFVRLLRQRGADLGLADSDLLDAGRGTCDWFVKRTDTNQGSVVGFAEGIAGDGSLISLQEASTIVETSFEVLCPAARPETLVAPKPKPKPEPSLPTTFGDGTYEVGRDIAPGTYRNDGSIYGQQAPCVAYLSTKPNELGTFISASNTSGPGILEVSEGQFVNVTSCKPWRLGR